MFQLAIGWGVQPSEFWNMTLPEWFALLDFNLSKEAQQSGAPTDFAAIKADMELSDAEWWKKHAS